MWTLPGPRALLDAVIRDVSRGRHVAVVLPRIRLDDEEFTDGLTDQLLQLFRDLGRDAVAMGRPGAGSDSVVAALSEALYCEPPAFTVPELLTHADAADRVLVLKTSDLPAAIRASVPGFVLRAVSESRTLTPQDRLALVLISGHQDLPTFPGGSPEEVQFASQWWWNRLNRWDIGALVAAATPQPAGLPAVVRDVLDETVVELARWDTDLAELLATGWHGHLDELPTLLGPRGPAAAFDADPVLARPGAEQLDPWDDGLVDGWHGSLSPHLRTLGPGPNVNSRIWAAQARVLLPWIEQKRSSVQDRAHAALGTQRFQSALQQLFDPALDPAEPVEVGPLERIIRIRLGDRHRSLKLAARQLRDARNRLAHLSPLRLDEITNLAETCQAY